MLYQLYATAGRPAAVSQLTTARRVSVCMEGRLMLMHIQAAGITATSPLLHAAV